MQYLKDYAQFNLWANTRMVDLFRPCAEVDLQREIISSFSNIRDTFKHLWAVEMVWMDRLKGVSPANFPFNSFQGNSAELFDLLLQSSRDYVQFLDNQDEKYFSTPLEFTLLTAAGVNNMVPAQMLHHLFNHQTMHRGQLITMARQIGITDFPRTDYLIWVREQG